MMQAESVLYSLALEQSQFGSFKYTILILCGLVIACISGSGSSLIQSRDIIACNLMINHNQQMRISFFTLIALIGGSLLIAIPSDLKSRLKPFTATLIFFGSSTLALGFCTECYCFGYLSVFRAFWASALSTITTVYVAETLTPRYRGSGLCCLQIFWLIGVIVMTVPSIPWRISQFSFGALALLLSILISRFLTESPRLLLSLDKTEAALDSLRKMYERNYNRDKNETEYPVKTLVDDLSSESENLNKLKTYVPQSLRPPWYSFFIVLQIQFVFNLCYFTMKYWFDEIGSRNVLIFPITPNAVDNCKLGNNYLPAEVKQFRDIKKNGSFVDSSCESVKINSDYYKEVLLLLTATLPILIFMILRIDHIGRTFFTVSSHVIAGILSFFVHHLIGNKQLSRKLYTCLMESMWIISCTASSCLVNEIFKTRFRVFGVGLANSFGYLGMYMGIYGLLLNSSDGKPNCIFVISIAGIIVTAGGLASLSLPDVVRINLK